MAIEEDEINSYVEQFKRQQAGPVSLFDVGEFEGRPVPPLRWLVKDRILMRNVALLQGDGATGKTTIALQLAVTVALGRNDWLGGIIDEPGNVIFYSAEEERDEFHYRLDKIVRHYDTSFAELGERLQLHCAAGENSVLAQATSKSISLIGTPLYEALLNTARIQKPKLVILESSADLYAGNESDRSQVRRFVQMLRAISLAADCAVLLLSHPSVQGMATGTGTSGSTAWNNAVRSRMYFTREEGEEGEDNNNPSTRDRRVLKIMKSNFGPLTESVRVIFKAGAFAPEQIFSSDSRDAKCDQVFLDLLARYTDQDRPVTDKFASNYAPKMFADEAIAKKSEFTKRHFERAMTRLFAANRIKVQSFGPKSKIRTRIVDLKRTDLFQSNVVQFPSGENDDR
jgi:RecA-family ATPase